MSLRIKLSVAFFLLAVVPLAGLSIYSYNSSLRALRQAAEQESTQLAQDMGARMETLNTDLRSGVQRLRLFPFQRLIPGTAPEEEAQQRQVLMRQLTAQMGETAGLIRALEFVPQFPPPRRGSGRGGARAGELRGLHEGDRLMIHRPGESTATIITMPALPGRGGEQSSTGKAIPPTHSQASAAAAEKIAKQVKALAARQAAERKQLGEMARKAMQDAENHQEQAKRQAAAQNQSAESSSKAVQETVKVFDSGSGRYLSAEVMGDGAPAGRVQAQVDFRDVLMHVLSRTRRRANEIPFALDATGKLHVCEPKDVARLEEVPLVKSAAAAGAEGRPLFDGQWVVVARKDAASGATFGIARPIGERLGELRRTAFRNLLYGLGMVSLALVGIMPLASRMTRNLRVLADGADKLAGGDLTVRVPMKTGDEIGQLAGAFNHMAAELEQNQKRLVEQERLQKELEMCRRIQEDLLPRGTLRSGIVEAKGVSIPAREVGGDFFNYFPLPDGRVALLVGDVSGKGLPAAMLMANLQATIQARLPMEQDLAQLADQLDRQIGAATAPEVYLTLFIAVLDTETQALHYVNAGHNPQFLLRANGIGERLESTGRPLGLLPGAGYQSRTLQLAEGDSLFFFTDGLIEAENSQGEEFGMERLAQLLKEGWEGGLEGRLAQIEAASRSFRGGIEAADDATMVLVRIGPREGSPAGG